MMIIRRLIAKFLLIWVGFFGILPLFSNAIANEIENRSGDEANINRLPSIFLPQKPTPSRIFANDFSMPEKIFNSNNLIKKPGSFYRAAGRPIILQGTINDSFGIPINGAIIDIWQANVSGRYHSLLKPNSEYIDKNFNMSGRTVSDNMGNYSFITIMPGSISNRAPHIKMNIYHEKFGELKTEIYFADQKLNEADFQYLSYKQEDIKLLTADLFGINDSISVYVFNIIMPGSHQFKKY